MGGGGSDREAAGRARRRALSAGLRLGLGAGAAALLAACRVRPMYGEFDPAGPVESYASDQDLQAIEILPVADRQGQILHNALRNALNPSGVPANPAYRLDIDLSSSVGGGLLRLDATATRAIVTVAASYSLQLAAQPVPLVSGSASALSSYNIVDSEYATYRAEIEARERAIEEVARRIRQRLASWFIEARADGTLARKLYIGE